VEVVAITGHTLVAQRRSSGLRSRHMRVRISPGVRMVVRSSLECSPLCHSGDRGFESRRDRHIGLWLSLVERALREREVIGSNPVSPTMVRRSRPDHTEDGAQRWATGLETRAVGNGEGSTPSSSSSPKIPRIMR
jgi:hypothetical protein